MGTLLYHHPVGKSRRDGPFIFLRGPVPDSSPAYYYAAVAARRPPRETISFAKICQDGRWWTSSGRSRGAAAQSVHLATRGSEATGGAEGCGIAWAAAPLSSHPAPRRRSRTPSRSRPPARRAASIYTWVDEKWFLGNPCWGGEAGRARALTAYCHQ